MGKDMDIQKSDCPQQLNSCLRTGSGTNTVYKCSEATLTFNGGINENLKLCSTDYCNAPEEITTKFADNDDARPTILPSSQAKIEVLSS